MKTLQNVDTVGKMVYQCKLLGHAIKGWCLKYLNICFAMLSFVIHTKVTSTHKLIAFCVDFLHPIQM